MNRTGNYCAFYVAEPFSEFNLGANVAHDFCYYNMLRAWKAQDNSFPFVDSHGKTYSVRDGSDWEKTLKPRLRERLKASKNIILFLSSDTKDSRALREEIDYGINVCGLPVIVVYPEFAEKSQIIHNDALSYHIKTLWQQLPIFAKSMKNVPTLHIPLKKTIITDALNNRDFTVHGQKAKGCYCYPL